MSPVWSVLSEDADKLRQHTLSEAGDMESLEKMVNDSDSEEDSNENSSEAAPWFTVPNWKTVYLENKKDKN